MVDIDTLVSTRNALHRVAEHVLSAARKRETGHIGLQPGPGGFRTPPFDDGRVLAVVGTDVAMINGHDVRRAPLTTVRAAAEHLGTEPGFPWTKHPPATPFEPDESLDVDATAAQVLADWFALGDEALRRLPAENATDRPGTAQIYPEHFDLGLTAAEVNYGFSPGDEHIPSPYVYVGPHAGPPRRDEFWNAPFGAYRTADDVRTPDEALTFLLAARGLLATGTTS
ncbi:MAG: hypothetical protein ACRDV1_16170 [Actinomycetes bacterium]